MSEYFECRRCKTEYISNGNHDDKPTDIKKYHRYLGYCSLKCWNKLTNGEKMHDLRFASIYKDTKKREYNPLKEMLIHRHK